MDKIEFRKAALKKRRLIVDKDSKSIIIQQRLIELCKDYKHIGVYINMKDEVRTNIFIEKMLAYGNDIYVPTTTDTMMNFHKFCSFDELKVGKYGILESEGRVQNQLECLVIPLVAFDNQKNRLGMGKGYYDRFIKAHGDCTLIGIAFEEQHYNEIPVGEHDQRLDFVITENKVY